MNILVSGMVAGDPNHGGATWAVLQWVLGLRRLGHDVFLVEPLDTVPLDEVAAYFSQVVDEFELVGRAALLPPGSRSAWGVGYDEVERFAADADVLLNMSGLLRDDRLLDRLDRRVYVDLDPAFTQLWHEACGIDMGFDLHTHFVTVGLRVGVTDAIPTCGREWITTLPPIVLEEWAVGQQLALDAFTSVGSWRSYGSVELDGVRYGQKAHSVRELVKLPARTQSRLVLAMGIHPDERRDLELLDQCGWEIVDPAVVAGSPGAYREFVSGSRGEIGIAKEGYVVSQSGWFSDRSACYLAAGRPVVAQDTGFGDVLPTGEGLLAFAAVDDAAVALDEVTSAYDRHARAARAIAEEHLDSDRVLRRVLEMAGAC